MDAITINPERYIHNKSEIISQFRKNALNISENRLKQFYTGDVNIKRDIRINKPLNQIL